MGQEPVQIGLGGLGGAFLGSQIFVLFFGVLLGDGIQRQEAVPALSGDR